MRGCGSQQERARKVLAALKPFFRDARIRKVWHNYSFDRHVLANMGVAMAGFAGDTMHMARLWNSSRKGKGYTLENLSRRADCVPVIISSLDASLMPLSVSCAACFGRERLLECQQPASLTSGVLLLACLMQRGKEVTKQVICCQPRPDRHACFVSRELTSPGGANVAAMA